MSVSKTMSEALNTQFNEELNSAYIYDSMAANFYSQNLPGFALWMTLQASEERFHAEKILHYLDDNDERVYYAAMAQPKAEWKTALSAMQDALEHEKHISRCIHELIRLARKEDDIPTENFLAWYVAEQVEEESSAQELIDKLDFIGDNKYGLYQLDKEVSSRQREE